MLMPMLMKEGVDAEIEFESLFVRKNNNVKLMTYNKKS